MIRTVFVAACLALGLSAQASAAPVVIAPVEIPRESPKETRNYMMGARSW